MPMRVIQPITPNDKADSKEAAQILGVEPETLSQWRYLRKFEDRLPYFKVGRKVFYLKTDLYSFLATCRVGGTDTTGGEQ